MSTREDAFVIEVIRHDAPRALVAGAVIGATVTAARLVMPPGLTPMHALLSLAILAILVLGAWSMRNPGTPDVLIPWIFAATVTGMVLWIVGEFWQDPRVVAFSYVLLIMVTYGMWLLSWRPFAVSAATMGAASILAVNAREIPDAVDWSVAFVAALVGGGLLMKVRRGSMRDLAAVQDATSRLAMTDALTGTLNRHGLDVMLPKLVAPALRRDEEITVCFVDIDGLKRANDDHGHEFGDLVISTVARAVQGSVREGDLVARWGGDEFLVVGPAPGPDVHVLESRIQAGIAASGIDLRRWPGRVTVGFTSGSVGEDGVDALVTAADAAMYQVRRGRRQLRNSAE